MTFDAIYADYKNSSAQLLPVRQEMVALATKWGLKHTSYEAGPGWNVGCVWRTRGRLCAVGSVAPPTPTSCRTENSMGNYIIAQRLAPMRDVWKYDLLSSWEVAGGDIYNQFSLFSEVSKRSRNGDRGIAHPLHDLVLCPTPTNLQYSRFGQWGAAGEMRWPIVH